MAEKAEDRQAKLRRLQEEQKKLMEIVEREKNAAKQKKAEEEAKKQKEREAALAAAKPKPAAAKPKDPEEEDFQRQLDLIREMEGNAPKPVNAGQKPAAQVAVAAQAAKSEEEILADVLRQSMKDQEEAEKKQLEEIKRKAEAKIQAEKAAAKGVKEEPKKADAKPAAVELGFEFEGDLDDLDAQFLIAQQLEQAKANPAKANPAANANQVKVENKDNKDKADKVAAPVKADAKDDFDEVDFDLAGQEKLLAQFAAKAAKPENKDNKDKADKPAPKDDKPAAKVEPVAVAKVDKPAVNVAAAAAVAVVNKPAVQAPQLDADKLKLLVAAFGNMGNAAIAAAVNAADKPVEIPAPVVKIERKEVVVPVAVAKPVEAVAAPNLGGEPLDAKLLRQLCGLASALYAEKGKPVPADKGIQRAKHIEYLRKLQADSAKAIRQMEAEADVKAVVEPQVQAQAQVQQQPAPVAVVAAAEGNPNAPAAVVVAEGDKEAQAKANAAAAVAKP